MKTPLVNLVITIATTFWLTGCGTSDSSTPEVRNNLFEQPADNGDNTCGIRQTLLAQKVLDSDTDYYADILAMWKRINADTYENYPNGVPNGDSVDALTERFETTPLPTVYTEAEVDAVDGGPQTLPSSILDIFKEDGYKMVRYYIDEDAIDDAFIITSLVDDEIDFFIQRFPAAQRVDINISDPDSDFRAMFSNVNSYYIVVVNEGAHWIGVTPSSVYDSLTSGPVQDSVTFGRRYGDPSNFNTFTGLVLEIQKQ